MGGCRALLASLLALAALASVAVSACRISEFTCRSNNHCIRLDRFCDGVDDCLDKSDEPRYCTVCNRTYYGDVGKTYELELQKPQEERLPFLCHLTFTANGLMHGELVQLIFDAFNVGRYEATALDGCPDGYMQLSELGRPFTGGSWCGTSTGYAVYYSETTTVTVSIKLFQSAQHANTPFEYKLRYKFVGRDEAVVRFGSVGAPLERGEVVPGTYCSRNFYECYRKRCRLQSPNYPGMYPRNVTCYLTLRQKAVPNCKHAMISVRQESEHKMQIKRSVSMASMNKTTGRAIRTWKECTGERDHLIFYDGASTDDPVLVKFCGGDWLPKVVSRGSEMLVAFHSSPFSIPLHSTSVKSPLRGFELDVDVVFTDSDSLDYAKEARRCEFLVNATSADGDAETLTRAQGRFGHVLSPRHTLPPNTTCTYRFVGQPGDRVWVYFIAYSHQPLLPAREVITRSTRNATTIASCLTRLRIWDGGGDEILIGDHCDHDPPRLCDHTSLSNVSRITRPCSLQESYISTGNILTMQHFSEEGTALHPATFKLRYEFIDTRLGGEPWLGRRGEDPPPQPCSRVFRKIRAGDITSPRNVFLYGRGGASNLSCVYRLECGVGEKIRLSLHNASFGDYGSCATEADPHTGRPRCVKQEPGRSAQLTIYEAPWRDVRVSRACFCDNTSLTSDSNQRPIVYISNSRVLEIHFTVTRFNITEDYLDIYFHASFELVRAPECPRRQRLRGSGGEIEFVSPPHSRPDIYCDGLPWLVEAHENKSLFLLTWGTFMPAELGLEEIGARCPTKNRVLLYSGRPARLMRIVCPSTPNARQMAIHVFSEEWFGLGITDNTGPTFYLQPPRPPSFLVEFIGVEQGLAALNWLEISRSRASLLQQLQIDYTSNGNENDTLPADWDCPFRCPELNACISASLWCDGRPNCPSGFDEDDSHCDIKRRFFNYVPGGFYTVLGGAVAGVVSFTLFLCIAAGHRIRVHRRRKRLGKKKKRIDMRGPKRVPTEEMLIHPSASTTSS